MPQTFITKLQSDHPQITFQPSDNFRFHPPRTIYYDPSHPNFQLLSLHELAHALLKHHDYGLDIELIKIEVAAWQKTAELCRHYGIGYGSSFAEDNLDSYRDWLHRRSLCPHCQLNGFQRPNLDYHCPACHHTWQSRAKKH